MKHQLTFQTDSVLSNADIKSKRKQLPEAYDAVLEREEVSDRNKKRKRETQQQLTACFDFPQVNTVIPGINLLYIEF